MAFTAYHDGALGTFEKLCQLIVGALREVKAIAIVEQVLLQKLVSVLLEAMSWRHSMVHLKEQLQ